MSLTATDHHFLAAILMFHCLITGKTVSGDIESDKQVLLSLKDHIVLWNPVMIETPFTGWNSKDESPCNWPGISCNTRGNHVTAIDLSDTNIEGPLFRNFSRLPELEHLNLSANRIYGMIPDDLSKCRNLRALNLSNNIIRGEFNLTGLDNLEVLDLSNNRIQGNLRLMFPAKACRNLVVLKLSSNNLSGQVDDLFNLCRNLHSLDLGGNNFSGNLSFQFGRLLEYSVSMNSLDGEIPSRFFSENCNLLRLDLSDNFFVGQIPKEISNCKDLVSLNLYGNELSGEIPPEVGSISSLQSLLLGENSFSRDVPESLVMSNLSLLDLSRNGFGGDVQEVFGRLHQVKSLVLSGNSYTGGLLSSGIPELQNISELDLSENDFSGPLPVEISQMSNLKMLVLANNQFTGSIPHGYGNLSRLQALDLSFNNLSGSIPSSFRKLSSIFWLMLANNSLTGKIPAELGNCSSLLWLNLANNQLSGPIPPEFFNVGSNATAQFILSNQAGQTASGFSQCTNLMRWIPTTDSPLSSFTLFPGRRCEIKFDFLLKRGGPGYLQLRGNKLSGGLPSEISKMHHLGTLYLDDNGFYGQLPPQIGSLPLFTLQASKNMFSGEIPEEIGMLKRLQILDLSYNNFSGELPGSLSSLTDLSRFNISYNPYISGRVPSTGQLSTFDQSAFLGNPLLEHPFFPTEDGRRTSPSVPGKAVGEPAEELLDRFRFAFAFSYPFFFVLSFLGFLFLGNEKISPLKSERKSKRRRM
ncbi:putative LRR receptor-like serine/threonine-protein kinase [Sesamum alatum]|uniref:LRR receptor-like serine/threonine-protein kinase n=1 Tax=Sesamum alatum TaxID=300844 RepID=A0AAE2CTB5_9LAMI|nr:putative LRR receptor-like serine/threonine-protein kinase [Sesamum alatum]